MNRYKKSFPTKISIIAFLILISCHLGAEKKIALEKTEFAELPGWQENQTLQGSFAAFLEACGKLPELPDATEIKPGFGKMKYWRRACEAAVKIPAGDAKKIKEYFEKNFSLFVVLADAEAEGLFTGYYLSEIKGSRELKGKFIYPIYKLPEAADRNYTRKQIDAGALAGKGLELFYTDDPVQLFFLHLQGSGVVQFLADEKILIGFAGKNNYPYHAIGAELLKSGGIEKPVSAEKIKQWLYRHPLLQMELLEKNPSYIFFKEIPDGKVRGSSGVALTPGYSLAVDNAQIPYGAPLWLDTKLPGNVTFRRLMLAGDSGSGVKGIVRGDIFFGSGEAAERLAGEMQGKGRYYVLLPKESEK